MKKIIKLFIVVLILINITSCFNKKDSDNVIEAKKQMGVLEGNNDVSNLADNPIDEIENNIKEEDAPNNYNDKKNNIEIINLTTEKFLEFSSLEGVDLSSGEVEIKGNTLTGVDEIIVEFSNSDSEYPDDNYKLQTFKSGDKTFLYRAFSNYETLDFGINEYIFTAKSGDKKSKTKIIINMQKEDGNNNSTNNFLGDINFELLPIGENFGNPKQIGNGKITYSDIKGLEIIKKDSHSYDCSINQETDKYYITQILEENIDSQFWWNTCKPFGNNEGISYFVLRLDGNNYIYEKHIYLNNGIYGKYELEKGEDFITDEDTAENKNIKLQEKNNELKDKNEQFTVIEIVNDLFTQIINNLKN